MTLIRAGLPILKALDLLAERLTDPKLTPYINAVREDVRKGTLLSEAFRQQGIFPKIYVTSVMAGEKSGSLVEVLERYIVYQKLALGSAQEGSGFADVPERADRAGDPADGVSGDLCGAEFRHALLQHVGATAHDYALSDRHRHHGAHLCAGLRGGAGGAGSSCSYWWSRKEAAQEKIDRVKIKTPLFGDIWIKYQVAQFSRVLSTLLTGGIPLMQGLETAADSLGTPLLRKTLEKAGKMVREGQSLSSSLAATGIFPGLSVDMIEVGESTGALPAMLTSVAEFYEDDVNTKMTAVLSLDRARHHDFHGHFRGVRADCAVPADLLAGRYDPLIEP